MPKLKTKRSAVKRFRSTGTGKIKHGRVGKRHNLGNKPAKRMAHLRGSTVLNRKAAGMLARNFTPGFRIALHHKDMGILTAAAREAGVVTPLGSLVAQLMASALANGDGGLDHSALLLGVERLSGKEAAQ